MIPRNSATPQKLNFREDIEGLRGVAILLVVLGHAGVAGFGGGFIGVDVFFVISGFLITRLLLHELQQTSRIDFWKFYARRARRLVPAFAVMMLGALIALAWLAPGLDEELQVSSAIWAALWSSNIYFASADFGYFESSARDSMLLHTWSLGVEEQFYLVWPAFLLCVWKLSKSSHARAITNSITVVAGVGFLLSLWATTYIPIAAYYLMPFRLWELAVGGCCTSLAARQQNAGSTIPHAGLLGAALLAAACLGFSEHLAYPGVWALAPVVGAALLLLADDSAPRGMISRSLSSTPIKFIGRISYGWYLWHWPALVLIHRLGADDASGVAVAVLGSFILAVLSYALIESTTRYRPLTRSRQTVLAGVLASSALVLLSSTWYRQSLHETNRATAAKKGVRSMISVPEIYSMPDCDEWYSSDQLHPCTFNSGEGRPTAVILGDSVGLHWFPAFRQVFSDAEWNFTVLTKSSCPIVDEPFFYERIHRIYTECDTWRKAAVAYIQKVKPAMVIIGSSGANGFTADQWTEGSRRLINQLSAHTTQILILAPSPRLPFNGPNCVIQNLDALQNGATNVCVAQLSEIEDRRIIEALNRAVEGYPNVAVMNLNDVVCPQGACTAWKSGQLVYRDAQHLNASYVASLKQDVAVRLAPYLLPHVVTPTK